MNGTNETKGSLIDYYQTNRKKTLILSLKKGFFKSFSRQNKINSNIMISRYGFLYSYV